MSNTSKKVLSYMGFARKSGNLVAGTGTCIATMKKGKVKLMIVAEDISENGEKKIMKEIRRAAVPYIKYGSGDEMSQAVGLPARSTFAILEKGFADTIAKAIAFESEGAENANEDPAESEQANNTDDRESDA